MATGRRNSGLSKEAGQDMQFDNAAERISFYA